MKRTQPELLRLQEIAGAFYAAKMSRDDARSAVIDLIAGWLHCSRVSLWRFDGPPGALALMCFASKVTGGTLETSQRRLTASEYREYFDALARRGMYASDDAQADPHLESMKAGYLLPNGVRSMLDAAFMVNGRAFGMVCCEQTDALRQWRAAEITGLRAIVGKLAVLMAGHADEVLWSAPSLPLLPLRISA